MQPSSIVRSAFPGLVLAFGMTLAAAEATPFNHAGLGLKIGESAGPLGLQLSANLTRDLQVNAGWGSSGISINFGDANEFSFQSQFVAARYYYGGWYASTGYTRKTATVSLTSEGEEYTSSRTEHGIPLHLGYEFGGRTGFYTTFSAGYLAILGGGGETVRVASGLEAAQTSSAMSDVSFGVGLGYYLF